MRWTAKRDAAEPDIVKALVAAGATVQRLDLTNGPDLLVGYAGKNYLLEVKSGKADGLDRRKVRTPGQLAWAVAWAGGKPTVTYSPMEALSAIGFNLPDALAEYEAGKGKP